MSEFEGKDREFRQDETEGHTKHEDPLMRALHRVIVLSVKALAILMTGVIVFGVFDVVFVLVNRLITPPFMLLQISDILETFGAFMAVLIAIEIFENIMVYLRKDIIHIKLVMATALMAIARKVIILDFKNTDAEFVYGLAAVVLAMSLGYYLVVIHGRAPKGKTSLLRQGEED